MGTSDQHDSGQRWREDLPNSWEDCDRYPPLAGGRTEDPEIIKQPGTTTLALDGSDRWVRADSDDVLYPADYR